MVSEHDGFTEQEIPAAPNNGNYILILINIHVAKYTLSSFICTPDKAHLPVPDQLPAEPVS